MKHLIKLKVLVFSLIVISSCSSDDDSPTPENINLADAILTDFPFVEIDYLNIEIKQPIIDNNEEVKKGEIFITLPRTITSLTLKSVNIDTNKFNLFPSIGTQIQFSETEFVEYTITSKSNVEKSLHYNVKIIAAPNPDEEKLDLIDFELLANDNSTYTNIDLIKKSKLQSIDSLVICLFPTSVDFSDLTPAIKYKGSKIEYRVNDGNFVEYNVSTGNSIDFKYPNTVDFKISNSINSKSILYRIIVDTQHPVLLNNSEITIPDLQIGNTYNGARIATWSNIGNYPITTMSPNEYTNVITPTTGLNNIFTFTLSKNSGGNINPDESGIINIIVTNTPLVGQYESTAVFNLNFNENSWKIVNSPTDDFINNIGYKNVEVKIKGTITN